MTNRRFSAPRPGRFIIPGYIPEWDITKDNRHRRCGGYMGMSGYSGVRCSKCGGWNVA